MTATRAHAAQLPSLEPGDHLNAEEFMRIYALRPDIHRAELVQGVVYVPSPVKIEEHSDPVSLMTAWLANYAAMHPHCRSSSDGTIYLSDLDVVQPDATLRRLDGNARVRPDGYLGGAPELVVEVANTSAAYDLHSKKESYRRAGVLEYVVWTTRDGLIRWFALYDGEYVEVQAEEGIFTSRVFPGLYLDAARLLRGDRTAILPVLPPED